MERILHYRLRCPCLRWVGLLSMEAGTPQAIVQSDTYHRITKDITYYVSVLTITLIILLRWETYVLAYNFKSG